MQKFMIYILVIFCCSTVFLNPSFAEKKSIAIMKLEAEFMDESERKEFDDIMLNTFSNYNDIDVIPNNALQTTMTNMGLEECAYIDCAVNIGKELGADNVVVGNIRLFSTVYVMELQIADLITGETVYQKMIKARENPKENFTGLIEEGVEAIIAPAGIEASGTDIEEDRGRTFPSESRRTEKQKSKPVELERATSKEISGPDTDEISEFESSPIEERKSKEVKMLDEIIEKGYMKKSVAYPKTLYLTDQKATKDIEPEEANYILTHLEETLAVPRFNYIPLSDNFVSEFSQEAKATVTEKGKVGYDGIGNILQNTLMPQITNALESTKELRAQERMSETEMAKMVRQKAKEMAASPEDIAGLMNSSYVFVPMVTSYTEEKEEDNYTYTIKGGVMWYHVEYDEKTDTYSMEFIGADSTKASGTGSMTKVNDSYNSMRMDGEWITGQEYAYRTAVKQFGRNLAVKMKKRDEFKLAAPAVKEDGKVVFELNKKHGIGLDDKFDLVSDEGEKKLKRHGFIRVSKVARGDSTGINSEGKLVINKTNNLFGEDEAADEFYYPFVMEHPRLGLDLTGSFRYWMMSVEEGSAGGLDVEKNGFSVMGFDAAAKYNMAKLLGISQLYLTMHVNLGWHTMKAQIDSEDANGGLLLGFSGGIEKKFYMGRMAFPLSIQYGLQAFSVSYKHENDYISSFSNSAAGLILGSGIEYAFNADINIGLHANFYMMGKSDTWTYSVTDDEGEPYGDSIDYEGGPEVSHTGLSFDIIATYNPPSLPFDPWSWIRGRIGL